MNARLGETEYAKLVDPACLRPSRCGEFYRRPDFPDRYDANQLIRLRCADTGVIREEVEALYAGTGLPFRKVSGYDPAVWERVAADLEREGWTVSREATRSPRRGAEASRPR